MPRKISGLSLKLAIPTSTNFQPAQAAEPLPSTSSVASNSPPKLKSPNIPLQGRQMSQRLNSLYRELQDVQADIGARRQPWRETLNADLSNVHSIVESENHRKNGLNMVYFDDTRSFVQALSEALPEARRERAVFRVDDRPNGPHHAVADIRREPGKPLTMIVVEPATMGHYAHFFSHAAFAQLVKETPGLEDTRMAVIDADAQKSPADCVMFSLSFASKMQKEAALFERWHEKLANGEKIASPASEKDSLSADTPVIDGLQVLPASFFKHAHSMTKLFEMRPEIADAQVRSQSTTGTAETLVQRKERYSQQRFTSEGERTYNASIEFKRHHLLRRTIETLGNTDTRDDAATER